MILTPSVLCSEKFKENVDMSPILEEYGEDLINKDVVDQEVLLWQRKWLAVAITKCDEKRFPNLFVLLKIACTFPITSAECERSFSAMRRLRTWLRASMVQLQLWTYLLLEAKVQNGSLWNISNLGLGHNSVAVNISCKNE